MATLSLWSATTWNLYNSQAPTSLSIFHLQRTNLSFVQSIASSPSLILSSPKRNVAALSFVAKSTETESVETESDAQVVESTETEQVAEAEEPKREEVFAVVMVGSRQYIVHPGRFIYTQRLKGANVNDKITLNKVLLVGTKTSPYIGRPIVPNAVVQAVVEEQTLDKKVVVFKYKKKKNYRRNIGHRQPITRVRITSITGYQDSPVATLP